MDDKIKIRCPGCTRVFGEKMNRVRDGLQVNCPNCCKLITLSKETEDPFLRRALKTAREMRAAEQDRMASQVYKGTASEPPRER
ncbi:hypothetical protein [Bradyrhizobium sp. USDA 3650]